MATTVEPTRTGQLQLPQQRNPGIGSASGSSWPVRSSWPCWRWRAGSCWPAGSGRKQFAARSLNQARAAAEAGNLPLASSELQKLIAAYKGTDAASEAVITLNQVRMVNGQSELAVVGLREFLAGKPAPKYVTPATGLLGRGPGELQAVGRRRQRLYAGLERCRRRLSEGQVPGRCRTGLPGRREAGGGGYGLPDRAPEVSRSRPASPRRRSGWRS